MSGTQRDLSNNPFLALFNSVENALSYKTSATYEDDDTSVNTAEEPVKLHVNASDSAAQEVADINRIIEDVFLITISKSCSRLSARVFLEDLASRGNAYLALDELDQAVFERIMLVKPWLHLVKAETSSKREVNPAVTVNPIQYLLESFQRLYNIRTSSKHFKSSQYQQIFDRCQAAIAQNSRLCFQQPDLFDALSNKKPSEVLIDQLMNSPHSTLSTVDADTSLSYVELVANAVNDNQDDGSTYDVFRPVLDIVQQRLNNLSLSSSELLPLADLVVIFVRIPCLAQVFVRHITPQVVTHARAYEDTVLGLLLSVSCLFKLDGRPPEFFDRPSRLTQTDVDSTEGMIYQLLEAVQEKSYQIVHSLLKHGGSIKEGILTWLGQCLNANAGRAKMWSHHMPPEMFSASFSSDSFFLNLGVVMLRLSLPFCAADPQMILRVQPTYCLATTGDRTVALSRKVHMIDLKETCMVPTLETDSPPMECDTSYTFMTECFFMTHFTLHLGFRVMHERLVKLNQEVHRIQQIYQDISRQGVGAGGSDAFQRLKEDLEKVMTVYMCLKAAMTQPILLENSFSFYVATATYLVHSSSQSDRAAAAAAAAAAEQVAPKVLQCLPELLAENLQDFLLFVHRFKDQLFEQCTGLDQLLTFILVFMGSPHLMRNPHLRAGMAEALETLLPPRSDSQHSSQSLLVSTHFQRERLFQTHAMVERLATALVSVFVSIEMTGQGVQFEYKFKYRQPMYLALRYVWQIDQHRDTLKQLAVYAEEHIEDAEAPLFLRFINLLINDAIYLLDEALNYMAQIKQKQESRDAGEWQSLPPNQRQEVENGFRHMSMLARFHNIMGNETIQALEMITTEIRSIFTNNVMVDRIASMLNYFLLHLVGPKKKDLKVKNFEEFQFRPRQLVANICRIYINLGAGDENFCRAVSRDGRSYSHGLFEQADAVLCKIHEPADVISQFNDVGRKIQAMATSQEAEDELFDNVPEDFIDPIMGDLMRDPVILPSSGKIVDRSTIARHILSDQFDPFNRQPLTMDMVKPAVELKEQIDTWLAENRRK